MAIAGISSASSFASSQQALHAPGQHKPGAHGTHSLTARGAPGSSPAAAKSPGGKIGNKINITV